MSLVNVELKTIIVRGALFALIWYILSGGAVASWWIGLPAVVLAFFTSTALLPPKTIVLHQFLKFMPFFLKRSLLGGVDVAWRAFKPTMPIDPDLIEYSTRLPKGLPQVFMANTISLLPGTLSAAFDQNVLRVHVLDVQSDFLSELEDVERRVARMFAISADLFEGGK
jgi:multicomponent Na+:H+ antiporter subunit E